ncbi:MAG: 16S rRNA (cytosine(1402)-N(4))-methyltransferase RsmH [Clostridia bacterium]|nr:16S rRNA (cytosine(1402)-N(4))-methyltransferase RsmH [Clostridia bacterium]
MEFHHTSVLLAEAVDALAVEEGGLYVDCTLGGGGHTAEILRRGGRVIGIDRDGEAIEAAARRIGPDPAFEAIRANYVSLKAIAEKKMIVGKVAGVLFDLGVSSHQLDDPSRGFSYHTDAALDMRMDTREELSAKKLVNEASEAELSRILFEYGEEKMARAIARAIVERRKIREIESTLELSEIIKEAMPPKMRRDKHPAKRSFQAIRIAVNGELSGLPPALEAAYEILKPGGRLAVITFHSLEDRIVKNFFRDMETGCTCPPEFPVCVCGKTPRMKSVIRKPLEAGKEELETNPRARSAKLRAGEKIK